jgi:hypothetical protein
MLRLLKSGTMQSLRVLCAIGRLQCDPADPLVGTLSGSRPRWDASATSVNRYGFALDPRGMGGSIASGVSQSNRAHARFARFLEARGGYQLQEWQVPLVALQETLGQVEDWAQTA